VEELGKTHSAFYSLIDENNGIGSQGILHEGTEEQKRKYLPRMAKGELIGVFALTEPNAGSDAANIETEAVKDGNHFVINGTKHFITNADKAGLFTVIAVTDPKLRARGGITAFLVEKGDPGFSLGKKHRVMGRAGSRPSELVFDNCVVPEENILGELGEGFRGAMKVLDEGRVVCAASCLGTADYLLDLSVKFAKSRETFGKPIIQRQAIQWMIADMATEIYAARNMVYHAAREIDKGMRASREAAMTKLFASEMVCKAADKALQIHGGMGYDKDMPIERIYRDVRIQRIWEGTSEIQRMIIAKSFM